MTQGGDAKDRVAKLTYVSRETFSKLERYVEQLIKWNPSINLVAKSTLDDLWRRHILDSTQLWPLIPQQVKTWVDLGSGAGFPGLVLAAIASDQNPDLKVTLIESDARKCAFLRNTARAMKIDINVMTQRIETLGDQQFDGVSARALASLSQLLDYSGAILVPNGTCLFLKGQGYAMEIEQAQSDHRFDVDVLPSETASDARILRITGLN